MRIYQFISDGQIWFEGTIEMCDNNFGLRQNATEEDVLSFAENQQVKVNIIEDGKIIETIDFSENEEDECCDNVLDEEEIVYPLNTKWNKAWFYIKIFVVVLLLIAGGLFAIYSPQIDPRIGGAFICVILAQGLREHINFKYGLWKRVSTREFIQKHKL